jgi:hypothetical protein
MNISREKIQCTWFCTSYSAAGTKRTTQISNCTEQEAIARHIKLMAPVDEYRKRCEARDKEW